MRLIKIPPLLSLFLYIISSLVQANNHLPIEAYGALPEVSMVRISPNGERIALRYAKNEQDLLVIKELKTGNTLGGVALNKNMANSLYFIDESRVIIRAVEYRSIRGYKGRHDVSSAFIYDVDKNKMRQLLIPGFGIFRGQTGLGQIVGLSPDGKSAYMPAYIGDDAKVQEAPKLTLMRVRLNKKSKPKKLKQGTHHAIDYFVNQNGELLARESYNNQTNIHEVERYDNDEGWVTIFSEKTPYRTKGFVGLTPDRKSLVMLTESKNGRDDYFTMSLADGKISEPLFQRDDADVERVLTDIQRVVYGVQYSGFKPSYAFFDKKLDNTFKMLQKAMPNNSFRIDDYTPDWKQILFYMEGESTSGDYFLFANNGFTHVASARPDVNATDVNPVEITEYQARDGLIIPTLVTTPIKHKGNLKNLPAIMLPHGGPESYDKYGFDWLAQYFANRGFIVIQPQFRGSDGFGSTHVLKGRGEWGKKMQDDLIDGIHHLTKKGTIDPNKVCIVGISYGGYAALAGVAFTPEVYKCAISINGVSNVEEMLEDDKDQYGDDHWVVAYWQEVINSKNLGEDFLASISPINHIDKIKAPILLVHGRHDSVVPFEQSSDMHEELSDAGKEVTFVELKKEGHHLNKNRTRIQTMVAVEKFIQTHML